MIPARELRIGNWAYIGKNPIQVDSIIGWDEEGEENNYLNPIPLTPELLEKAGFKYSASFGECRYEKSELQMDENFNPLAQEDTEFMYYGKRIVHLHQLQNLYFALTGEELEITL